LTKFNRYVNLAPGQEIGRGIEVIRQQRTWFKNKLYKEGGEEG